MRGLLRKIKRRNTGLVEQARPEYLNIMLRGGRMTKVAGRAASFAPSLGPSLGPSLCVLMTSVASIALGSAMTVTGAVAGSCTGASGVYSCAGPLSPVDTTQTITNAAGVTVTTDPGFGIDTTGTGGTAFRVRLPTGTQIAAAAE